MFSEGIFHLICINYGASVIGELLQSFKSANRKIRGSDPMVCRKENDAALGS